MNRTTIACPRCHHDDNDLLRLVRDDTRFVVGQLLHCRRCESAWINSADRHLAVSRP